MNCLKIFDESSSDNKREDASLKYEAYENKMLRTNFP